MIFFLDYASRCKYASSCRGRQPAAFISRCSLLLIDFLLSLRHLMPPKMMMITDVIDKCIRWGRCSRGRWWWDDYDVSFRLMTPWFSSDTPTFRRPIDAIVIDFSIIDFSTFLFSRFSRPQIMRNITPMMMQIFRQTFRCADEANRRCRDVGGDYADYDIFATFSMCHFADYDTNIIFHLLMRPAEDVLHFSSTLIFSFVRRKHWCGRREMISMLMRFSTFSMCRVVRFLVLLRLSQCSMPLMITMCRCRCGRWRLQPFHFDVLMKDFLWWCASLDVPM